jgi:hypothetical protein
MDNKRALQYLTEAGVYLPAVVPGLGLGGFYVFSSLKVLGHGTTIEAALNAAISADLVPDLPPRPQFLASQYSVVRSGSVVATTTSKTMALRIANALNLYNPNERGF